MNIKELKLTPAYQELKAYVDMHVPEADRPIELGRLVKRFLARFNADLFYYNRDRGLENLRLITAFSWRDTAEGHDWWHWIELGNGIDLNPCPIRYKAGVAEFDVVKVKKAPVRKKKVGWW